MLLALEKEIIRTLITIAITGKDVEKAVYELTRTEIWQQAENLSEEDPAFHFFAPNPIVIDDDDSEGAEVDEAHRVAQPPVPVIAAREPAPSAKEDNQGERRNPEASDGGEGQADGEGEVLDSGKGQGEQDGEDKDEQELDQASLQHEIEEGGQKDDPGRDGDEDERQEEQETDVPDDGRQPGNERGVTPSFSRLDNDSDKEDPEATPPATNDSDEEELEPTPPATRHSTRLSQSIPSFAGQQQQEQKKKRRKSKPKTPAFISEDSDGEDARSQRSSRNDKNGKRKLQAKRPACASDERSDSEDAGPQLSKEDGDGQEASFFVPVNPMALSSFWRPIRRPDIFVRSFSRSEIHVPT